MWQEGEQGELAPIVTWFRKRECYPGTFYVMLVLAIMLPLFRPGYLLALDLSWTPNIRVPGIANNYYIFFLALHLLSYVLPSQLIEKVLLFVILWLAAYGTHRLVRKWGNVDAWACYFAGIFYIFSPFAYSRFLAGQYLILLAFGLMPWFLSALLTFLINPNLSSSCRLTLWVATVSIVDLHSIFFMAILVMISLVGMSLAKTVDLRSALKWGIAATLTWVVLSSYWLLPLLLGRSSTADLIDNFTAQFVRAFQTVGDPKYGVVFNAAAMYGFWVDKVGRYVLPKSLIGIWPGIATLFIGLSLLGLTVARQQALAWIMFATGLIALVLGVGTAYDPFAPIFYWLFYHVPFFKGFREPEKFIGLLVLALAYLGSIGASWLANCVRQRLIKTRGEVLGSFMLPILILVMPFIYNPLEMWGFAGQMKPTNYPSDWYLTNRQLNLDPSNFKVLFLPWHMYLSFSFTNGVIANPASSFFNKPIIQGNNIQIANIYTGVNTPTSLYVEEHILTEGPSVTDIGENLDHLDIKYVLVAKNFDAGQYQWLNHQIDLKQVANTRNLLVYKNDAWKPPAHPAG